MCFWLPARAHECILILPRFCRMYLASPCWGMCMMRCAMFLLNVYGPLSDFVPRMSGLNFSHGLNNLYSKKSNSAQGML